MLYVPFNYAMGPNTGFGWEILEEKVPKNREEVREIATLIAKKHHLANVVPLNFIELPK